MLSNLAWKSTDRIIRVQLAMLQTLGSQINLTRDDQSLALEIDDDTWLGWMGFLSNGPLPPQPPVPEMLQRLAEAAFHLSIIADRHATAG